VLVPGRNIGGLIAVEHDFFVAIDDFCGTVEGNPVFAAGVVHSQPEGCAQFDRKSASSCGRRLLRALCRSVLQGGVRWCAPHGPLC
jgi:hypothetical protein